MLNMYQYLNILIHINRTHEVKLKLKYFFTFVFVFVIVLLTFFILCVQMFTSTHYGGKKVIMDFAKGEAYKKVFGPIFVYLNSFPIKTPFKSLWSDAVQQVLIIMTFNTHI